MKTDNILISRTDAIGDVILTLPMAGVLKSHYPNARIIFLGRAYTKDIIACEEHVDEFVDWDEITKGNEADQLKAFEALNIDVCIHVFPRVEVCRLAKKAKIPVRIGTARRVHTFLNCTHRVNFSRKKSDLHESQLNIKLLDPLGIDHNYTLEELYQFLSFKSTTSLPENLVPLATNKTVVLHPKSKGSAVEWGIPNFVKLSELLVTTGYKVVVTGTEDEGKLFRDSFTFSDNIVDLSGKMNLAELAAFIGQCKTIVAASTGPLHIGAATGIQAIGLYIPKRPMHPGRWRPLGPKSLALVHNETCDPCGKGCDCITKITPETVVGQL